MTFVDFDICNRMVSLRKLYSVTLTYFFNVKDSNRDLPTLANAHTSVTNSSADSNSNLSILANTHTSVTRASTAVLKVAP